MDESLPSLVLATLRALGLNGHPPLVVAVSGGRDSRVLLHAVCAIWPADALLLAHVHHGLQPEADDWQAFCRQLAGEAGIGFDARRLPPRDEPGIENWARRHRYLALADMAAAAGAQVVLTGHHANDQLETAQMRQLRGAGPLGLGAMRVVSPLPGRPGLRLVRPLLAVSRATLARYAQHHGLGWVEDPSNRDPAYRRNQIRARIDEAIRRDPSTLPRGLAAIDAMQREADARRQTAETDLSAARLQLLSADGPGAGQPDGLLLAGGSRPPPEPSLSRAALARLPGGRADEALRAWLASLDLRMPSRAKLAEIGRQLLGADAVECRVLHDGCWLVRYRDRIAALPQIPAAITPTWFRWQGEASIDVGGVLLDFIPVDASNPVPGNADALGGPAVAAGIDPVLLMDRDLLLDRAASTDRIRLDPATHRRRWKNLVQERGIPTWLRPALPTLRTADGQLVFAAPFGMDCRGAPQLPQPWETAVGPSPRIRIQWRMPEALRDWI